jgi:putative phosphoserine phosphatase/1-acylglycerol-3-phosphate O-acyltransferase
MDTYEHVIRHVADLPSGPEVGAVFDFDGTIIDGFSAFIFLREQLKKGHISPLDVVEIMATIANYKLGMVGFSGLMDVGAKILSGVDEDDYRDFSDEVYEDYIKAIVYPEARALIKAHLDRGHTVAIVSSATPYQVEPLAADLGVEHIYCTHYEVDGGEFTGEVLRPICWGEGKVLALEQLAEEEGVDLSQTCFYTDSDDDLLALERVGFPWVVNPNESLLTEASQNGWPVQEFARTGKPSLMEYVRSIGVYGSLLASYFTGVGVWKLNGSKDEGRRFMLSLFTELSFALIGAKLSVRNPENLWKRQPVVVVFNHQSQADGLIVMKLLRDNFSGVGKQEMSRFKLLTEAYKFAGIIPIDRANSASAIEAMQPLVDALAIEGRNVVIAPEGTRSETKKPGPFKKGAFHVAMQAKAPVLPIVIHNAIDIQPKGQFAYRPGKIEVEVLPPIETKDWSVESLDMHIAEVRNLFLDALGYDQEPVTAKAAKGASKSKPKAGSKASAASRRAESKH